MNLKLKNIKFSGNDNSTVYLSIEARYGWEGDMCGDMIRIHFNKNSKESYVTVKIKNPGIGFIIERIIEMLKKYGFDSKSLINPPLVIIERLSEVFGMEYDPKQVNEALKLY